jgi:hypothetical protein
MVPVNRDILGRRVQVILHVRVFSPGYTPREWWAAVMHRRSRGYWPRTDLNAPWPIFRYWNLGPLDIRVWTARAMREQVTPSESSPQSSPLSVCEASQ